MIDYGQNPEEIYRIETRMDLPMEIWGVKVFYLGNVIFAGIFTLYIFRSMLLALMAVGLMIAWYRASYKAEQQGKPLLFNSRVVRIVNRIPEFLRTAFFPSLYGTESHDKYYRQ